MKRLTVHRDNGTAYLSNETTVRSHEEAIDRLAYYEDMEEQGRLVVLPCKVGDTVYHPSTKQHRCSHYGEIKDDCACQGCEEECDGWNESYVFVGKVSAIHLYKNNLATAKVFFEEKHDNSTFNIGLNLFLTREEAEQALKGGTDIGVRLS